MIERNVTYNQPAAVGRRRARRHRRRRMAPVLVQQLQEHIVEFRVRLVL